MLSGKLVVNVATAVDENAPQKITVLTLDFNGVTDQAAMAYIVRQVKIDLQRGWRKNGIPEAATVEIAKLTAGLKVQEPISVQTEAARAKTMTTAEMADLVKILQERISADAKPEEKKEEPKVPEKAKK